MQTESDIQVTHSYVAVAQNALPHSFCDEFSSRIHPNGQLAITEAHIETLAESQKKLFAQYREQYFKDIKLAEESNHYSLEIDTLHNLSHDNGTFIGGGKSKSQRFLSFLYSFYSTDIEVKFDSDGIGTYLLSYGSCLIFPPYFTHRFSVSSKHKNLDKIILVHACHHY